MQIAKDGDYTSTSDTDIFDGRYYRINTRMLHYYGQWPLQPIRQRIVRTLIILTFSFTLLIPQTLKLVQSWGDVNLFVETLSPLVANLGFNFKLANCIFNTKKIARLIESTRENWKNTRSLTELEILQRYGEKGRFLSIVYIILINGVGVAWISTPLLPILMDYLLPLNESRPNIILFQADYKIDSEKYFYWIHFHGSSSCMVGIQLIVCHDTLYMAISKHACAILAILRYRLENLVDLDEKSNEILRGNLPEHVYYKELVSCVKFHKRAIEYIRVMESSCEWCLFIVVGFNMLVMSCTGCQTVAKGLPRENAIRFGFYTIAVVVHLYCNTLPGQWIIDSSSLIRDAAYNCKWYLMSGRSRKVLLLLIRQSVEPCCITAGKMYVMSLENFCSVLQTSMSYFTLLTSLQ